MRTRGERINRRWSVDPMPSIQTLPLTPPCLDMLEYLIRTNLTPIHVRNTIPENQSTCFGFWTSPSVARPHLRQANRGYGQALAASHRDGCEYPNPRYPIEFADIHIVRLPRPEASWTRGWSLHIFGKRNRAQAQMACSYAHTRRHTQLDNGPGRGCHTSRSEPVRQFDQVEIPRYQRSLVLALAQARAA